MMKKISSIIAIFFVLCFLFMIPASAKAYQTYTYSIDGFALNSPDAYVPQDPVIDSAYIGLTGKNPKTGATDARYSAISSPTDLEVDENGNVYIVDSADKQAGRVIVLDKYYKLKFVIHDFINDQGNPDELEKPQGVFITEDTIFVCDTNKSRIVTFNLDGTFQSIIPKPESELFEEGAIYTPVALAVDQFDRLYVVSSNTSEGVIVMTREGEFTGFIGAQKVATSTWENIWRKLQSDEQRALSGTNLSVEFNNITITEDGFIYVTTDAIDQGKQASAMKKGNKKGDYSPVKMLNAAGEEIMRRNGFWPPAGEVATFLSSTDEDVPVGPSQIVDVAVGPQKTWSIIDKKRSKVYTYDFDGNLLFVFGDKGGQLGNIATLGAIVYQEDKMLLLDQSNKSFTIFRRTEYGNILIQALENQNNRRFDIAYQDWNKILQRNSNYDAAYIGIGQSLYREGRHEEAIEKFQAAYDTSNYDKAYKAIREKWITDWILLIPVGIIVICVAWMLFMKYCNKINSKAAVAGGKRNFKEQFLYAFHVIFHPFDGFWDLKHEKRGSLKASIVYILLTVLAFFYQAVGSGYSIQQQTVYTTIIDQAIAVLVPVMLWAISNWCLTCLFEGEGSFKDIMTAMGYALVPLILTIIPTTIASNFVISTEVEILNLITTIGFIWSFMLIFFGMMVTHDYTIGKNLLTTVGTLIAMVFIMFVAILFTTLLGKVVSFITNIVTEINYRS